MKRTLLRILICLAFYPSHWVNRLMCGLGLWHQADWVDEHVAFGSLPTRDDLVRLKGEGVRAVVNMCGEFGGDKTTLTSLELTQLHLPTLDYHCPSDAHLREGLEFLKTQIDAGAKVFVHCKAGRGRSAILVLCYVMTRDRITAAEALAILKRARPRLARGIERHREVCKIERECTTTTDEQPDQ